jgi:hypothetical protein
MGLTAYADAKPWRSQIIKYVDNLKMIFPTHYFEGELSRITIHVEYRQILFLQVVSEKGHAPAHETNIGKRVAHTMTTHLIL